MSMEIKIGTLNVNGLASADKRRLLFHFLWLADVDIVALQEPHAIDTDSDFWLLNWPGQALLSYYTAFLVKPNLTINEIYRSQDSRILGVNVTKGKLSLDLATVYIPSDNDTRNAFLTSWVNDVTVGLSGFLFGLI